MPKITNYIIRKHLVTEEDAVQALNSSKSLICRKRVYMLSQSGDDTLAYLIQNYANSLSDVETADMDEVAHKSTYKLHFTKSNTHVNFTDGTASVSISWGVARVIRKFSPSNYIECLSIYLDENTTIMRYLDKNEGINVVVDLVPAPKEEQKRPLHDVARTDVTADFRFFWPSLCSKPFCDWDEEEKKWVKSGGVA